MSACRLVGSVIITSLPEPPASESYSTCLPDRSAHLHVMIRTRHRALQLKQIFSPRLRTRDTASARDLSPMAIYHKYHDYGGDDPTFYDDAARRGAIRQPYESYAYKDAGGEVLAEYANGDCMEIGYGKPSSWEEYHRRSVFPKYSRWTQAGIEFFTS
ncbi:hypothetical protein K438DRAFT_1751074 [Mycena galopus ATCC 62051]|nr:hypothetical protein K438DRAFT_1751074 [Mycena galopus ATCC 62051]